MLTLHLHSVMCVDPEALVAVSLPSNAAAAGVQPGHLEGVWYKVFPETATDVRRLSFFAHHVDKFAPADGSGMLISMRAMQALLH